MNILSKNIFALLILQGSNYIIPLVTFPYLAKILQVESFGYYGLIFAITQYLVLFIDFGYNLSASKRIVEAKNNNIKISKIFFQTIIAKSILSLFVLLLVFLYHFLSESHLSNLIIFSSFQIIGTVLFPIWFFQGIEKMKLITVASISGKLLTLPWIFVFVKNSEDLDIAIFLQSISYFTTGIISLILIYSYKIISLVKVSFCDIKKSYLDSYQIYIAGLAISLYSISTPIIIKTFSSIEQVGFFTGADKLKSAGLGIFLIMGHALYPRVNNLFSESRVKAFAFVRKIFLYQGLITISVSILVYIFAGEIIRLILGEGFYNSIIVLKVLSPLFFLITQSVVFGNYILLPLGYKKTYTLLPVFAALIHIFTCSILTYKFGAIGGALSILMIEILTFLIYIRILFNTKIIYEWLKV